MNGPAGGRKPARNHKPLPLVGLIEIARYAGVRRPVVSSWRTRYSDFPRPVAELAVGPVFWEPDIARWLLATGRSVDQNRQDIWPEGAARRNDMLSTLNKLRDQ
jgi:hypothetical protein